MANKYPAWIDEYARSMHQAFSNMIPASWGPLDGFAVFGALNGTFIDKVHEAVKKIKAGDPTPETLRKSFTNPSALRAGIMFLMVEYQFSEYKNKDKTRETIEFLVRCLKTMNLRDLFVSKENIAHSDKEVAAILDRTDWHEADTAHAREIGKLYNSLSSLVYALYRDFFPQDACDIYGPYDAGGKFGDNTILLLKHFTKLNAKELWPELTGIKYNDVKIYQVYKDVQFRCEVIGMHSIYKGDVFNGLRAYSVSADGETLDLARIKEASESCALKATEYSESYEKLGPEKLKTRFLECMCYHFYHLFGLAGMDWKPTEKMKNALRGKDIPSRMLVESFPDYEEFVSSPDYEVYWLKDLYNEV